ncbi:MAG: GIY-YIG nuclease family protein [Bacteroidetes bacterium]|nr:GIY-YIG nuclease family protein [Bacteroidota bacterium]
MYYVYILKCSDGTFYKGCTSDLNDRINRHKLGYIKYTQNRLPIELVTYLVFSDRYRAFEFEKYLKSGSGRAFMKKRLI